MTGIRKKILVSLDSLLDTRLGAMRAYSEGLFQHLWRDSAYYNRLVDDYEHFGAGTTLMWKNVYKQRGELKNEKGQFKVLALSNPTMMCAIVGVMLRDTYAQAIDDPIVKGCDVFINTYPYNLPEVDQNEISLAMEELILPGDVEDGALLFDSKITCVYLPHEHLTVDAMREDWNTVIMYDWFDWFDVQAKAIYESKRGATLTGFIVPEMLREMVKRKTLMDSNGKLQNPFTEVKRTLALSFQLSFWSPACFSLPNPYDLIEATKMKAAQSTA